MGVASRTVAAGWIVEGRVAVDGRTRRDPEFPVAHGGVRITVDGIEAGAGPRVHIVLNKPRGLVTSARDEQGRDTVYRCLDGAGLPWLMPVGRLDKASEGLLLFCNDSEWAARITDPATGPDKTYHVQVGGLSELASIGRLVAGIDCEGERLSAKSAVLLRRGEKNAWLEIVLDEGRNRQIRRLLAAQGLDVLRLVRVAIGPVLLGDLAKGAWRTLSESEVAGLVPSGNRGDP